MKSMKRVSFVESTVGTVKSIYRRKYSANLYSVSIKLIDCRRAINKENKDDEDFYFLISAEQKESLFAVKKGDTVTIKETQGKIIQVMEGEHFPAEGKYEFISYPIPKIHCRFKD